MRQHTNIFKKIYLSNPTLTLYLSILIGLIVMFFSSIPVFAGSQYEVLFISSYNSRFPTFFDQYNGLRSVLPEDQFIIDIESMDSKRFQSEENVSNFYDRLTYKLTHTTRYDAIVVADDAAYQFALTYQHELFEGLPIVFLGINQTSAGLAANNISNVTGIIENIELNETVNIAKKMLPDATNIIAIVDDTTSGQGDLEKFYQIRDNDISNNYTYSALDLRTLSFEDLQYKLSEMTNEDIVILLAAYSDNTGTIVSFEKSLELITSHTAVPIFHPYEHGIGNGLVGGYVINHYNQGQIAGEIVYAILVTKIDIDTIYVNTQSESQFLFDENVIEIFNLDKNKLPRDTLFINKPESFYQSHKSIIHLFIIVTAILLIFIFGLIISYYKSKHSQRKLSTQTHELSELYEELQSSEEELRHHNELLIETRNSLEIQKHELILKQKQIEDYAYFDFLTHLPNRHYLKMDVERLLEKEDSNIIKGGLYFIDLDDFKLINDHYGHNFGDEALIEISQMLTESVDHFGKIYRYGGDEFIALIKGNNDYTTFEYIAHSIFNKFSVPLNISGSIFKLSFSMGIAMIPLHGKDFDSLIATADMAMYEAKKKGKNTYFFFDDNTKIMQTLYLGMKNALSTAIEEEDFTMMYQPIFDNKNNTLTCIEAMIRWQYEGEAISPDIFIPVIKELGLLNKMSRFVFKKVFEFYPKLKGLSMISINLSTYEFENLLFIPEIEQLTKSLSLEPGTICIEISEHVVENNFDRINKQIDLLKKMGFYIMIDNFASDYFSLNDLKKLPVDFVKMDVSLFHESHANHHLIKPLIDILNQLNIGIIIKNIETNEELEMIQNYKPQYCQGRIFDYPLSESDILKRFQSTKTSEKS